MDTGTVNEYRRFFVELAYQGTQYVGWQRQPNGVSVQEVIEKVLSLILRDEITVVGCGRTDAGVHASRYFLHFDTKNDLPKGLLGRINKFLPPDIAFRSIWSVNIDQHARFDATHRRYEYHLCFQKDPFRQHLVYYFPFYQQINRKLLNQAAALLLNYEDFYPFCKSKSDAKTMRCQLRESYWQDTEQGLVYHIGANRFLRGMVRLITGMCLNVAIGKMPLSRVQEALQKQQRLQLNWSVPAAGLYLTDVQYAVNLSNIV